MHIPTSRLLLEFTPPLSLPPPPRFRRHPLSVTLDTKFWTQLYFGGGGGMLLYDNIQLTSHYGFVNHVIPSKILRPPSPGDQ